MILDLILAVLKMIEVAADLSLGQVLERTLIVDTLSCLLQDLAVDIGRKDGDRNIGTKPQSITYNQSKSVWLLTRGTARTPDTHAPFLRDNRRNNLVLDDIEYFLVAIEFRDVNRKSIAQMLLLIGI